MRSMSVYVALLGLALSGNVWAQNIALPEGTISLRPIQGVLVDPPAINCPPGSNCDPIATAVIEFTLGCGNSLGPVSYTGQRAADGKMDVWVSAFELVSADSENMMCVRAPIGIARLVFGFGYFSKEQVRLHWLNEVGSSRTL